eukprot:scaffold271750_cov22-Tisochrysis_lutea.AAC.2
MKSAAGNSTLPKRRHTASGREPTQTENGWRQDEGEVCCFVRCTYDLVIFMCPLQASRGEGQGAFPEKTQCIDSLLLLLLLLFSCLLKTSAHLFTHQTRMQGRQGKPAEREGGRTKAAGHPTTISMMS